MRDRLDKLGDNTDVVLVTFTDPENLPAYRQKHRLEIDVVVDPSRSSYRAFGLGRGSLGRIWGLRAAKRYIEIFMADGFGGLERPTEDTRQLGGDFIIDPEGTLIYGFWGEGPADRPDVEDLIRTLDRQMDQ